MYNFLTAIAAQEVTVFGFYFFPFKIDELRRRQADFNVALPWPCDLALQEGRGKNYLS